MELTSSEYIMVLVYSPGWFRGAEIVLELFSVVVALFIAFYSYRVYRLVKEHKYFFFGVAFGLLALSFAARIFTLLYIAAESASGVLVPALRHTAKGESIFFIGRLAYMLFVLIAYLGILLVSMRMKNPNIVALLSAFVAIFAFLAYKSSMLFYIITLILLVFVSMQYYSNFTARRTANTFWIFIAFLLLAVEYLIYIFTAYASALNIGAYIFRLIAYFVLLIIILRVFYARKEKPAGDSV